jgi:catechol 2,3-dioxygenase-like lactoylglutathione lyase family enzyme
MLLVAWDVLSNRILLHPGDLDSSRRFYRDVLGPAVYRWFDLPVIPGLVSFLGARASDL